MGKVLNFRATKKAEDIINKYMNVHHIANRSLAINTIIESFPSESQKHEKPVEAESYSYTHAPMTAQPQQAQRICPCDECKHFFEPKDPLKFPDFIKSL